MILSPSQRTLRVAWQTLFLRGCQHVVGCYLGDASADGGRKRLVRELDRLQSIGVTNIRLLGGSKPRPSPARFQTASPARRTINENLLRGLDFCLAEMGKRHARDSLPFRLLAMERRVSQRVRWATGDTIPDPDLPAKGRATGTSSCNSRPGSIKRQTPSNSTAITSRVLSTASLIMAARIATTRHHDLGTWQRTPPCADDKTADKDVPIFCDWVDSTARFIHDHAPNQLALHRQRRPHRQRAKANAFIAALNHRH